MSSSAINSESMLNHQVQDITDIADFVPGLQISEAFGRSSDRPVIRGASVIHVLITGEDKLAAVERAVAGGPLAEAPIRVALTAPCPVTVHYAA